MDPDKHHAVHLAAVRQACAESPSRVLKNFLQSSQSIVMPDQVMQLVQQRQPPDDRFVDIQSATEADAEALAASTATSHPRKANKFLAN